MALVAGTRLGPYEIVSAIGAGGMGEVYRARDTRLDRTVAIKVLNSALASSPELKARFEREARAISQLNHPHICTLHDIGHDQASNTDFLVMEFIEGGSLADRLGKGPLPLDELLKIGCEIADALDKAHRAGIIHRDLKPGNVMLTKSGAKLLDFGLAKPAAMSAGAGSGSAPLLSAAVTMTSPSPQPSPLTQQGTIIGTVQYMSPEQIEGKEADARSDIFAFGAVLYEMATGKRAFEGKSQLSVATAILEKDPESICAVRSVAPPALDHCVRACLAKDREHRRQTVRDVLVDLRWIAEEIAHPSTVPALARTKQEYLVAIAGLLVVASAGAFAAWWLARRSSPAAPVSRFTISMPAGQSLGGSWYWYPAITLSSDGSRIAYVANRGGTSQIYLRPLNELNAQAVPGTEGGHTPFFSPDGQWLGFFSEGKLKKVPTFGGPPVTIATLHAYTIYGACWGPDDTIYFGVDAPLGLLKVSAAGGTPEPVTKLDANQRETDHRFPQLLPGGKTLLFVVRNGDEPSFDEADIVALSLATGKQKILIKSGTDPHYLATGHLVFVRGGVLFAVPFDPVHLEMKGAVTPVVESVVENPRIGAGQLGVSANGSLVFIPGGISYGEHDLVLVDKTGAVRPLTATPRPYEDFTISPDGRFLATTIEGPLTDTWIHDVARDTDTRFTFGVEHRDPAWSPDGKRVTYDGYKDGKYGLFWKPLDGSGPEERLVASDVPMFPWFWSPDGRVLLYQVISPTTNDDIWMLTLDGRKTQPLIATPFDDEWVSVSPDGRWIAFNNDESGRQEVYVAPFPALNPRTRVSTDGGLHPLWARNGRELYYRTGPSLQAIAERTFAAGSRVMAVPIETKTGFRAGKPHMLFEGPYFDSSHDYGITPDDRGFVMIREKHAEAAPATIHVVLNWFEELKHRVPSGQ